MNTEYNERREADENRRGDEVPISVTMCIAEQPSDIHGKPINLIVSVEKNNVNNTCISTEGIMSFMFCIYGYGNNICEQLRFFETL